jgi:hypothetical protein
MPKVKGKRKKLKVKKEIVLLLAANTNTNTNTITTTANYGLMDSDNFSTPRSSDGEKRVVGSQCRSQFLL